MLTEIRDTYGDTIRVHTTPLTSNVYIVVEERIVGEVSTAEVSLTLDQARKLRAALKEALNDA